ncbi:hypothetical protein R3P38DRAFT_2779642 [Favolaschia claudopus]|uniref:Uncharacterized protein n=1 Tax=Favolaschia claudopus TaxID=2862362 RepID=A0AAW0BE11_9AGAR
MFLVFEAAQSQSELGHEARKRLKAAPTQIRGDASQIRLQHDAFEAEVIEYVCRLNVRRKSSQASPFGDIGPPSHLEAKKGTPPGRIQKQPTIFYATGCHVRNLSGTSGFTIPDSVLSAVSDPENSANSEPPERVNTIGTPLGCERSRVEGTKRIYNEKRPNLTVGTQHTKSDQTIACGGKEKKPITRLLLQPASS